MLKAAGSDPKSAGSPATTWVVALILAGFAAAYPAWVAWKELRWTQRARNERAAAAATHSLFTALILFPDGETPKSGSIYTGDVRGLGELGLIDPQIAAADPSYPDARPYHGYWFTLLERDAINPTGAKVAACSYPARYGRDAFSTFLWTLEVPQLKADTRGVPPPRVPTMPELQRDWAKFD